MYPWAFGTEHGLIDCAALRGSNNGPVVAPNMETCNELMTLHNFAVKQMASLSDTCFRMFCGTRGAVAPQSFSDPGQSCVRHNQASLSYETWFSVLV